LKAAAHNAADKVIVKEMETLFDKALEKTGDGASLQVGMVASRLVYRK
jgi:hypothetical protein